MWMRWYTVGPQKYMPIGPGGGGSSTVPREYESWIRMVIGEASSWCGLRRNVAGGHSGCRSEHRAELEVVAERPGPHVVESLRRGENRRSRERDDGGALAIAERLGPD